MNKTKENIVLVGGGGHCKSCIEVIEATGSYIIKGIIDKPENYGKAILGYQVIGNDNDYLKFKKLGYAFLISVGQIKTATIRTKIFNALKKIDAKIATVIAPTARVSKYAQLCEGSIIMHHSLVNAGAVIGDNCIINSAAIVEHDSFIQSHVHVSTKAVVNGGCKIGKESFIGSNACLAEEVEVGAKVLIGAGSIVINHCLQPGTYVGNPAKKIDGR